jgi:hypothetical protein
MIEGIFLVGFLGLILIGAIILLIVVWDDDKF